jgi:hypothetical protein
MVGSAAGVTVMVRVTGANALPHASVAVQVSVIVPPQSGGVAEKVEGFDVPLIRQPPANPLVKVIVLGAGTDPQATVISEGAVMVGSAAGVTVMVLVTGARNLPHASVAVQVSVIVPPQAGGVAEKVDGLEVPLIKQPPANPLVYVIVLGAGTDPHATVISEGAVIVGSAAGVTVMVRVTGANALPHASVAVHVSVMVPPHAGGVAEKVDGLDVPLIRQPPANPLVYVIVLGAGTEPHATVISEGAVIVGNAAGVTVMVRVTGAKDLPQASVAVQVSVIVPPQAGGVAEKVDTSDVPVMRHPPANPLV